MLKIAMCGTHGTGKTTAANELRDALEGVYPAGVLRVKVLPEVARACPFPINQQAGPEAQRWIFHRQILAELEAAAECDVLICDRSIYDSLAYSLVARGGALLDGRQTGWEFIGPAFRQADEWAAGYDRVYVFESGRYPLQDDGVRCVDPVFQREVENMFQSHIYPRVAAFTSLAKPWPGAEEAFEDVAEWISDNYLIANGAA